MTDPNYECSTCGGEQNNCDCEAEGYECHTCGETPTWRDLQRGICRGCRWGNAEALVQLREDELREDR